MRKNADQSGKSIGDVLDLKGVSGTVPLEKRPGMKRFLEKAVKKGVKEIFVANERRLARSLLVQEDAIQQLRAHGLALVHIGNPT
eukprot:669647-Alexandrium_andersonii.AAC.1